MQVGPHDGVVSSSIDDTAAALAAERSREDAWKTVGGGGNIGSGSTGSQVFKYRSFRWPPLPSDSSSAAHRFARNFPKLR